MTNIPLAVGGNLYVLDKPFRDKWEQVYGSSFRKYHISVNQASVRGDTDKVREFIQRVNHIKQLIAMTTEEKLDVLKEWLKAHNFAIEVPENYPEEVVFLVPEKNIAVCVAEPERTRKLYLVLKAIGQRAYFVREEEDKDFLLDKMRNCVEGLDTKRAQIRERKRKKKAEDKAKAEKKAAEEKAAEAPKHKRHRIRIPQKAAYEKITQRH